MRIRKTKKQLVGTLAQVAEYTKKGLKNKDIMKLCNIESPQLLNYYFRVIHSSRFTNIK